MEGSGVQSSSIYWCATRAISWLEFSRRIKRQCFQLSSNHTEIGFLFFLSLSLHIHNKLVWSLDIVYWIESVECGVKMSLITTRLWLWLCVMGEFVDLCAFIATIFPVEWIMQPRLEHTWKVKLLSTTTLPNTHWFCTSDTTNANAFNVYRAPVNFRRISTQQIMHKSHFGHAHIKSIAHSYTLHTNTVHMCAVHFRVGEAHIVVAVQMRCLGLTK